MWLMLQKDCGVWQIDIFALISQINSSLYGQLELGSVQGQTNTDGSKDSDKALAKVHSFKKTSVKLVKQLLCTYMTRYVLPYSRHDSE